MSKFHSPHEMLTFDDVLICPAYSEVTPNMVNVSTHLTRDIKLNIPIISAAMDTVTGGKMARKMAQLGGIGVIHRNMPTAEQVKTIKKVKQSEANVIKVPVTIYSDQNVHDAKQIMSHKKISGIPVLSRDDERVVGILTKRDIAFITDSNALVKKHMTPNPHCISGINTPLEVIKETLRAHKIEKLPIVDNENRCIGLVTFKDLQNAQKYPDASRMYDGTLTVGAAVGTDIERTVALIEAGASVIFIDTAHGHSIRVLECIKSVRNMFHDKVQIIGGNVVTYEGAKALIDAGVNAVKIGIGPGSICTTRVIAGVGYPQLSAIMEITSKFDSGDMHFIADGGIRTSGDIVKAIGAGASSVMLGSLLAGTDEAPGEISYNDGIYQKQYRGMGSLAAMDTDRYGYQKSSKFVPEGVEAKVQYKGPVVKTISNLVGGLKSGMGYTGVSNIKDLQKKSQFIKISNASLVESHTHNIISKDVN